MSPLDASVTLEEVFAVVQAKRVPLAAELAGYLVLEIAEGADPQGGDVDPKSVFIGEEGTVALVKRRDASAAVTGDAETSLRAILTRLLDTSGSQTPALGAVARRKAVGSLEPLVAELEAALIPVNRSAGRRALARLSREAKRVTLGVGRNATASSAALPAATGPAAPSTLPHSAPPPAPPPVPPVTPQPPKVEPRDEGPSSTTAKVQVPSFRPSSAPPPAPEVTPPPSPPVPAPAAVGKDDLGDQLPTQPLVRPQPLPPAPPAPPAADVDQLLSSFEVSEQKGEQDMSRALKAMVGLDPTPPPADVAPKGPPPAPAGGAPASAAQKAQDDADIEALLALSDPAAPVAEGKPAAPAPANPAAAAPPVAATPPLPAPLPPAPPPGPPLAPPAAGRPPKAQPKPVDERALPTGPSLRKKAPKVNHGERRLLVGLTLVALTAGGIALWALRPSIVAHLNGAQAPAPPPTVRGTPSAAPLATVAAPPCRAALTVTDVPAQSEVLLRVGVAPTDVERMPVGTRLEFVALAEGYVPRRVSVPAGAPWDKGPDGRPRYEVAVQLDPTKGKGGPPDPWPSAEPGSEVGGAGPPGTVHVVSSPRGAEVWLLAGVGPEARIEQLRCQDDVDVLVAGPGPFRKRLHVGASEFVSTPPAAGAPVTATTQAASVSAKR